MARKLKFPLEMADETKVRNIEDLKEHFDLEKVMGYFLDGKLLTWLSGRYYDEEAQAVEELSKEDSDLSQKLCNIFGVSFQPLEQEVSTEKIEARNLKLAKLKQYTDDEEILANVDIVAFDQEELANLLHEGRTTIYLCEGKFTIPKSKQDLSYIEVGNVTLSGRKKDPDKYEFKIRDRYIFDPKIEELYTNEAGEKYNIQLKSIYLKNVTKNTEIMITEDREAVSEDKSEYIIWKDKIIYVSELDGVKQIVMRDTQNNKTVLFSDKIEDSIIFISVDDDKVVWRESDWDDGFGFSNEKEIHVSYYNIPELHKFEIETDGNIKIIGDNCFYIDYRELFVHNILSGKSKLVQKDIQKISAYGNQLYAANNQKIYKIDGETFDVSFIGPLSALNVRDVRYLLAFAVYQDDLIWVVDSSSDRKLTMGNVNIETRNSTILDSWKGSYHSSTSLKLSEDWIEYSYSEVGENGFKKKIKYDGTEKMDIDEKDGAAE